MIHWSFLCFNIRPPLLTFDSQPLDLGFVQPSGASLPSIGIGIPSRCSHPRGFSIVFPGQRKKNHQSPSNVLTPWITLHAHAAFFLLGHSFHHDSVLFLLPSKFSPGKFLSWHDEAIAREFQTCFRQRHQNIWRKIWNLSASLFPSSLICNILCASCQPLLTEIKVLPLSCRDIILYEYFAGSTTNHICPLALIWLASPTGIHIIHPSSSSPSVLHPSLIAIHNNSIKTSIQGLSWIIPDFKNKRYPSWRWWICVLFSYWQSRSARSLSSFFFVLCPLRPASLSFSTLLSHPALPFSSLPTRRAQYVGSNSGEVRSKVSHCLLSPGRIKARRLLRNGHKVCSCLQGVKKERGSRRRETVERVVKRKRKKEKSS